MKMSLRKTCFFHHHQVKKMRVKVMKFKTLVKKKAHQNKTKCFISHRISVKCTLYLLLLLSLIHSRQNLNKK